MPVTIEGVVISGRRLGRTLGVPTANIDASTAEAANGAYVATIEGLGATRGGVASLGTRPTVEAMGARLLEVHIFDWEEDIYGRHVRITLLHKLHDEVKFDSLAALTQQMRRDIDDARRMLAARRLER